MKPVLWESSAGALDALFATRGPLNMADLYTVTLADNQVFRWSGSDVQLTANSQTWVLGPGLRRSTMRWTVGLEVDTVAIDLADNLGTVISGQALIPFIAGGGLAEARVEIARAFWALGATSPTGLLLWFAGRVSDIPDINRFSARLTVASDLELLDVKVPRDVYQVPCLNTVFDSACGLSRATYTTTSTASGASSADRTSFPHSLAQAAGYFNLGVVTFTGGPNAGQVRTVKQHTGGAVVVALPWPFAVASGHAFSIRPGCDGLQATCSSKFSNLPRFRGQPYIPAQETVT